MEPKSRKPPGPQLVYNCSLIVGLLLVVVGVYLLAGLGWSMVSGGSLMLILTLFAAVRLTRTDARVLDRQPSSD